MPFACSHAANRPKYSGESSACTGKKAGSICRAGGTFIIIAWSAPLTTAAVKLERPDAKERDRHPGIAGAVQDEGPRCDRSDGCERVVPDFLRPSRLVRVGEGPVHVDERKPRLVDDSV